MKRFRKEMRMQIRTSQGHLKPAPVTNNHQATQQSSPSIVTLIQASSAVVPNTFKQSVLKLEETLDNVIYIKMYHVPQFKSDYVIMVHKKVEKR